MKTYLFFSIMFCCLIGIALAQYDANILQQQANADTQGMAIDTQVIQSRQADIIAKNNDLQSIQSDPAYNTAIAETVNNAVSNPVQSNTVCQPPSGPCQNFTDCCSGVCNGSTCK